MDCIPSEHRVWGVEECVACLAGFFNVAESEEEEEEDAKVEEPVNVLNGDFPDSEYPTPHVLEEQIPDDLLRAEEDIELSDKEEKWKCPNCMHSPCSFLQ